MKRDVAADRHQTFFSCCLSTVWKDFAPVSGAEGKSWDSGDLGFRTGDLQLALPFPAAATEHRGPRRLLSFRLDQVIQWPPCPLVCSWCNCLETRVPIGVFCAGHRVLSPTSINLETALPLFMVLFSFFNTCFHVHSWV